MVCRTLYDVKSVAYDTQVYANYTSAIGETFQQILIHKDGLTIDTKSENAEYTELNGTRYTDGERVPLRTIGSLKFTKNFDSSLIDNHSELVKAGLGNILGGAGATSVVTAGKGSSGNPFLTIITTGLTDGNLVYIPSNGFRRVTSVVTDTSFTVDVPLNTTISTSTTFNVYKPVEITNPIGNCEKTFNFVISLNDGSYIKMMGCGINCEFNTVMEKQLTINFTITSPDVSILSSAPTGFTSATPETKGVPVKCTFTESLITNDDLEMVSYFVPNFDLGLTVSLEPMKVYGGLNNYLGYMCRSSIKPKVSFDRTTTCKAWVSNYRTSRVYSFFQSNFGLYIAGGKLTLIDQSTNLNNHDVIACEIDANYDKDLRVYLVLP